MLNTLFLVLSVAFYLLVQLILAGNHDTAIVIVINGSKEWSLLVNIAIYIGQSTYSVCLFFVLGRNDAIFICA